jgi:hypothetical protein
MMKLIRDYWVQRPEKSRWCKASSSLMVVALLSLAQLEAANAHDPETKQSGLKCPAKVFNTDELGGFVEQARRERTDLPPAPEQFEAIAYQRQCMYHYIENQIPEKGAGNHFVMDPYGEIYGFVTDCLRKHELSDAEVEAIIAEARTSNGDLPAPPTRYSKEIERTKCHYIYRELAEEDGVALVSIAVGPYGKIVEVRKNGKIVE